MEKGESIVDAVIREMKEETGLTVINPKLCGIKQFPLGGSYEKGRYLVFLFRADRFFGELTSSDEGKMQWVGKDELETVNLVDDFSELLEVMLDDNLNEFQYIVEDNEWIVVRK